MVPDPGHPPKAACGLRAPKTDTPLCYCWTSLHSPSCHRADCGWWASDCEAQLHTSIKHITACVFWSWETQKGIKPITCWNVKSWLRYWQWSLVFMALVVLTSAWSSSSPKYQVGWDFYVEDQRMHRIVRRKAQTPPSLSGAANKEVSSAGYQFGSCCSGAGPSHTAVRYCLQRWHKLNSMEKN